MARSWELVELNDRKLIVDWWKFCMVRQAKRSLSYLWERKEREKTALGEFSFAMYKANCVMDDTSQVGGGSPMERTERLWMTLHETRTISNPCYKSSFPGLTFGISVAKRAALYIFLK